MKVRLLGLLFFLLISLLYSMPSHATHSVGADLSYTCLGGNTYEITLNLYRDCDGVSAPSSATVSISSSNCGVNTNTILSRDPNSPEEISPICPSQSNTSTCQGGSYPGVEKYVYTGTFTFPQQCTDWTIGYDLCCRNNAITNLQNPGSQSMYVEATLDNTLSSCNNSPFFSTLPVPYNCSNQQFFYNHGAVDSDGDSLAFSLIDPLDDANNPIPHTGGLSATNPLNTTSGFSFDNQTGQMSFTPSGQQQAVVTVLVKEYRNGQLIGTTMRDIQIITTNCNNTLPTVSGIDGSNNYSVDVCAGKELCFDVFSDDADANQSTTISWNNGIPDATFNVSGSPHENGTFCWTTTKADSGSHFFNVTVEDDACPTTATNTYTYTVNVIGNPNPPVDAGQDTAICIGKSAQLQATTNGGGNISYNWSPNDNLSCTSCPNPVASPNSSRTYTVVATYPDGCTSEDQVTVSVTPYPSVSVYPGNASICTGESVTFTASSNLQASFEWGDGTTGPGKSVTPSSDTFYTVKAIANGCESGYDTANVSLNQAPSGATCNNIYVTPTGNGDGLSQSNPTNLGQALEKGQCNRVTIKMAKGTYTIDTAITSISSYMTLEGGFQPSNNWRKTSAPGATTIRRTDANPDGPPDAQRIVAIYMNNDQFFRFQDITIETDAATSSTGSGVTNYGIHMTNCSDYELVRTQIKAGSGSPGADGDDGADGANGSPGQDGFAGSTTDAGDPGHGGDGGSGAGSGSGAGGTGGSDANGSSCCNAGDFGQDGIASTSFRAGGGGAGGGSGGEGPNSGGPGGNSGLNSGGAGGGPGSNGSNGANGSDGVNGSNATGTGQGQHIGGFYVPGDGPDGQNGEGGEGGAGGGGGGGCPSCADGAGSGGAGGGGGGQGGEGGEGGDGGGGSFGIYLFNNGANGRIEDCRIVTGTGGPGGAGGVGGQGGAGGSGGAGATFTGGGTVGAGGDGGDGGAGGNGGDGAPGDDGQVSRAYLNSGASPVVFDSTFSLSSQPEIFVDNVDCTNETINFNATGSGSWTFGANSSPSNANGTSVNTQYSSAGRKTVNYNGNDYAGFANIAINSNAFTPNITSDAIKIGPDEYQVCRGDSVSFFNNSLGVAYDWDMGGGTTPNNFSTQNVTNVTFDNSGTYTVELRVKTDCCGWSNLGSVTMNVISSPNLSFAGDSAICEGESTSIAVSGASSYQWSPSTGLSSPTDSNVTINIQNTTTYTVKGISASGNCIADKPITIEVNDQPAITIQTTPVNCNSQGSATANVANGSGNFDYEWSTSPTQLSQTANNLSVGYYEVTVTDNATSCVDSASTNITNASTPVVYISNFTDVSCNGGNDGTATAAGSGGTTPYSYSWSNGDNGPTANNLPAGTHTVTLTDDNGCTATTSISISEPDPLYSFFTDTAAASCANAQDGYAVVQGDGGNGNYTYQWNVNPPQTGDTLSNVDAGNYFVNVTDDKGCSVTNFITIDGPPPIDPSVDSTKDIDCDGLSNGYIEVSASGGVQPYTYSFNNNAPQQSGTFSGVPAGNHTITVIDSNGCDTTLNVTINDPTTISLSVTTDSATCQGQADGSITVSASNGTSPYTYALDSGSFQSNNAFNNLEAGTYNVFVQDDNGCEDSTQVTVQEPAKLEADTARVDSVSCFGDSDGAIHITTRGGQPPYSYAKNAGPFQADSFFTGLNAGNYDITVKDANNCDTVISVSIGEPNPLNVVAATDSVTCFGGSDGEIVASVSGGTPPYSYSLDGFSFQNSNTFSGMQADSFNVWVKDANNCLDSTSAIVEEPPNLIPNVINTDSVSCAGGSDGSINIDATGGVSPYEYSFNGGPYQNSSSFTNVPADTHMIKVRDLLNCDTSFTVVVSEPNALAVSATADSVSCQGGSDGSINVTANGGQSPYQFALANGAYQNSNQFSNLQAGSYKVKVQDGNGCQDSSTISVAEPPQLTASVVQVDSVSCNGLSDGAVDLSASGGTPPYQYSGDGSNYQSSPTLNGFTAGAHTLYVQDANGCQTTVQATVDEPAPLSINIANTDSVSCNGGSDGAVTVNATGGTQAYTFTRDGNNYQSSPNFSGLTAGNYSITVEDANGCSAVASTTVHEPSQLSGQTSATDVSCSGGNDGSASVTANGGNGNYSYTWSGGQSGSSISNLTQGTYQVTVSDGQGCSLTDSVTVDGPPPITIQPTVTDLTCNGSSDGAVDLTVNGGTPGYNYAWSTSANGPDITNLNAGNFSATVTDMQGCEDSISVVVTEPAPLQFNAGKTDVQCNGQNNGKLYGSASGGTSPYSYSIDGSNYQSADTFSNLSAGSYTLYARDSNGCSTTKNLTIEEPPALEAQPANLQDPTCYGGDDGYASVIPSGGTPGYNYQWSNSSGSDSTAQNLSAGTYTVTVEDQNGCSVSLTIPINQPEQFAVKTEPAVDAKIRLGEETELKALPDPEQSNLTYEWSPSAGLSCQDCSDPTASPTTTTNYTVTARNQKGCTDSSRVVVRLEDNKLVRAPNAFTPDGDGLNDEFTPNTPGAKDIKFMIFNRWGEKVYETQQLGEGWNGTYKGEQCRPGTYVYYIKTTYDDGDQEEKEGSVTLIR